MTYEELLNEKEVAYLLNVSVFTLQKARRTGGFIPFIKVKSKVLYKRSDIIAYLEANTYNSTSEYHGGGDE